MITLLLHLLRLLPSLCGGHRPLALENVALRQQLAVYKRTASRPTLRRSGRPFWGRSVQNMDRVERPRHRGTGHGAAVASAARPRALDENLRAAHRGPPTRPPRGQGPCLTNGYGEPPVGAPRIHGRVEGWRGTSSGPSPAPSRSNGANGFPVRRSPADFASRVMGPIVLGVSSSTAPRHPIVVKQTGRRVEPRPTPPLPAEAPSAPRPHQMAPHLPLDPGLHE
jgi:hypothetical protein